MKLEKLHLQLTSHVKEIQPVVKQTAGKKKYNFFPGMWIEVFACIYAKTYLTL